jgi:hypothetical protein
MNAQPSTLGKLFQMEYRYVVPIFQRGYVWKREDQWERLWDDVLEETTILLSSAGIDLKHVRKHFLGAIVLAPGQARTGHVAEFEVIDGQQRLLTLQMLLAALRDVAAAKGFEAVSQRMGRLTANPSYVGTPEERYKVWPAAAYHEELRLIAETGSANAVAAKFPQRKRYGKMEPERPRLVEVYLFFADRILSMLDNPGEVDDKRGDILAAAPPEDRASAMADALDKCMELAVVDLDEEDDPQVIFETLNAFGVPLEPSDLVRNFIFLNAARRGFDVSRLYREYWHGFDSDGSGSTKYWKETQRQGRLNRSRLDLFLFHYLTARAGQEVKMGHLYQQYRAWWSNTIHADSEPELHAEMAQMVAWSATFRQLLSPAGDTRLAATATRLRIIDVTTAYPLILWLASRRGEMADGEFDGVLADLESYLVRRLVCRLSPKNYNRIFLSLLQKMQSESVPSRATFQKELRTLSEDTSVWPDDGTFRSSLEDTPIDLLLRKNQVNMILRALELGMRTTKQEDLKLPDGLTVEHVLPQSYTPDNWPFPADHPEGEFGETKERRRTRFLYSLGNLTLLTQPMNSTVSNGPFRTKRPEIAKSLLLLNAYFQGFDDEDSWDERDIAERGGALGDTALKVWPRPD